MNYANNASSSISISSTSSNDFQVVERPKERLQQEDSLEPTEKKSPTVGDTASIYHQAEPQLSSQPCQTLAVSSTKRKIHKCDHGQCHYHTAYKHDLKIHQRIHLPADRRPKQHKCYHDQCDYRTDNKSHIKRHQQIHLPADQRPQRPPRPPRPRIHKCDHDRCVYSTARKTDLTRHQQTHLPANQRPKIHKCDHDQCDFSTLRKENLKLHQRTHLPAELRPRNHKCGHDQCDFSTEQKKNLKRHQRTHLPAELRPKIHKCGHDQCNYSTEYKKNLKRHQRTHLPDELRPKIHKCDHDQCAYSTKHKKNLKRHQQTHLPTETSKMSGLDIDIVKQEAECTSWFNLKHRIDNQAPLWMAEPLIKKECSEFDTYQKARTYFTQIGIPKDKKVRAGINTAISYYKSLNNEPRERYLTERLWVQKHDGSIFSELKGQDEVVAYRDIEQWEVLGHYAGKHYSEDSYNNGFTTMQTTLRNIDRYSFSTTQGQFISGYRLGNVTSLINACQTYSPSETGRKLPEQNVSYMRHRDEGGRWLVFIIAIKKIETGVRLWIDYGKQYWESMSMPIAVTDSDDDQE